MKSTGRSGLGWFGLANADWLVAANGFEIEEQQEVDGCHRGRDERVRLECLAITNDARVSHSLLVRGLRHGLLRIRQLGAVKPCYLFQEKELAGGGRLVLLVHCRGS